MDTNVNASATITASHKDGWEMFVHQASQPASPMILRGQPVYCRLCAEQAHVPTQTLHYCSECNTGFCRYHGNFSRGTGLCTECGYTRKKLIALLKRRFKITKDLIEELTK